MNLELHSNKKRITFYTYMQRLIHKHPIRVQRFKQNTKSDWFKN